MDAVTNTYIMKMWFDSHLFEEGWEKMEEELRILTFGSLTIWKGGQVMTGLASRKAELLLVYLASQRRACARELLAELLWQDRSQSQAQANLRVVLSSFRKHLGEFVQIDRNLVGLKPGVRVWLDAGEIEAAMSAARGQAGLIPPETVDQIKRAVDLYKGKFLFGLYVPDARELEMWIEKERQHLHDMVVGALGLLADNFLQSGEYQAGVAFATRLVEMDPLSDAGQRQLMRLLALSGQRGAALSQYERFKLLLFQELNVDPEAETTRLQRQIQAGELLALVGRKLVKHPAVVHLPAYLQSERADATPPSVFVGRELELENLEAGLHEAIAGVGRLRFVIGSPGQGKTLLMEEFARRATATHHDLLMVRGGCSAFCGAGDSYLPFRDVLAMLTGDLVQKFSAGLINLEQARRLWKALPVTLLAIQERGPDLVGVLVPGNELYTRAALALDGQPDRLEHLTKLVQRDPPAPGELKLAAIFDEYLNVLCNLAQQHPLLVLLDDLQWADTASINLLFHIGRRIQAGRILLIASYRAEEVVLAEDDRGGMLARALAEFKRQYGDIWIDLGTATERHGRAFVDAYLDTEHNRLAEPFRKALFEHTGGHPLFTVELCRSLQERGILVRDPDHHWQVQGVLNWNDLPARVEGVVEARLGRLDEDQRAALLAAAVEGEEFTLQVVAEVCGKDEHWMLRQVSAEAGQANRLVREIGVSTINGRRLYHYRFSHGLYRDYLYQHLDGINRQWLHGQVGAALERFYADKADMIATRLGWHYREAGEIEKAIHYLLLAGDQAHARYAYTEAILFYQQAVNLLKESADYNRAARSLLKMGLTYHINLEFDRSRQAYTEGFRLWQRYASIQFASPILPAPHALRIALSVPAVLDKLSNTSFSMFIIYPQICSGLVAYNPDFGIAPDGALSWEIMDDGKKYIFHLREDAAWSDGVPVTAGDYVYAWKQTLNPDLQADGAILFYDLKGAKAYHQGRGSQKDVGVWAIDRFTLAAELEYPVGYFLNLLAYYLTFPMPEHINAASGECWLRPGALVSNGPYKIDVWSPGERMLLSRNLYYQGQFTGNVESVEIREYQDAFEQLRAYDADRLEILNLWFFSQMDILRQKYNRPVEYIELPRSGTTFLVFQSGKKPFDDLRVRQAFAHSIDKEVMINKSLPIFLPGMGGLVPPGLLGHSPGISLEYDPEEARRLLAEAGYPGGSNFPEVMILEADYPNLRLLVDALCRQWRQVLGVDVRQEFVSIKDPFFIEGKFHILSVSFTPGYPDCDHIFRAEIDDRFCKATGWQNETYDRLVQAARRELDQQARLAIYKQAEQILIHDAIVVPICYSIVPALIKPWVKRFPVSINGWEQWQHVVIEAH